MRKQLYTLKTTLVAILCCMTSIGWSQFDLNFGFEEIECGTYYIEAQGQEIPNELLWLVDGVTVQEEGTGYLLTVEDGQNVEVCITLPGLLDQPLFCSEFEGCQTDCPTEIIATSDNCWSHMYIPGIGADVDITWVHGDGTTVQAGNDHVHIYEQDAAYDISATFETEDCGLVTLSTGIDIDACTSGCDVFLSISYLDCDSIAAYAESEIGPVVWFLDDEYTQQMGSGFSDAVSPGWHTICAAVESFDCPFPELACQDFFVEDCSEACDLAIDISFLECDSVVVQATGEAEYIYWALDDQYTDQTGSWFDTANLEPGWHTVCAGIESPDCPWGNQVCQDFFVETCVDPCEVFLTIDYLDCDSIVAYAESEIGPVVWFLDDEFTQQVGSGFSDAVSPGWHTICAAVESIECPFPELACQDFFVEDCDAACDLVMDLSYFGCDSVVAFATGASEYIFWSIDGQYGDQVGNYFEASLEPGWHTICAGIETPDCPWGNEVCQDIFIEECVCNPQIEVTVQEDGSYVVVNVSENQDDAEFIWYSDGFLVDYQPTVQFF
ncbi:MAG: hypothetical protein HRT74_06600, partial [Flavobacteriales bacterium]|nr:hypothetical protein [Flavobacteriales bacterium]